jgi:hypothetical protein
MIALIAFDTLPNPPVSPGFFAGWQEVTHTIELADASHLTSAGTNEFYKSDGTLYRTGCSTAVGRRFEYRRAAAQRAKGIASTAAIGRRR